MERPSRNDLRLFEAMDEAFEKLSTDMMIAYGLGQEEPIWLDIEEYQYKHNDHLVCRSETGAVELVRIKNGTVARDLEYTYTHFILLPRS